MLLCFLLGLRPCRLVNGISPNEFPEVGASEGIDASDGVVSVEHWVSFKVTLSVGSRLLSVDSWLAVGGSLIVTLVLFFHTPGKKSVILDFFVIDNSFHLFALLFTSSCNSSDDG